MKIKDVIIQLLNENNIKHQWHSNEHQWGQWKDIFDGRISIKDFLSWSIVIHKDSIALGWRCLTISLCEPDSLEFLLKTIKFCTTTKCTLCRFPLDSGAQTEKKQINDWCEKHGS